MKKIKISEIVNGVESVRTETPVKKIKADVDLQMTPLQIEELIKSKQMRG